MSKDNVLDICAKSSIDNASSQEVQRKKVTSIGIRKSELLMKQYNHWAFQVFFLFTVFLVAYAYSLDSTIRRTFQATATSSYSQHALLSTVNVIKAVAAAYVNQLMLDFQIHLGDLKCVSLRLFSTPLELASCLKHMIFTDILGVRYCIKLVIRA